MSFQRAQTIEDLRLLAKKRLPKAVFDWLDVGTEDDITLRRNRSSFSQYVFLPKTMRDISQRQQSTVIFQIPTKSPFGIAPTGAAGMYGFKADIQLAKAAKKAGIPFILSTASFDSLEEVAHEAGGDLLWFQLYLSKNRHSAQKLIQRVQEAGYKTLVITADVALNGNREQNRRNCFTVPYRLTLKNVIDGILHPKWLIEVLLKTLVYKGIPMYVNDDNNKGKKITAPVSFQVGRDAVDWEDLQWLRSIWPHRLIVKGMVRVDDILQAKNYGIDGVILSNHGGRQLDGAISPIDILPEVRKGLGDDFPIMLDGGIFRGADIAKAIALGANFVFVGRATLYGLSVGGYDGVKYALDILRTELDRVQGLLGCKSITELNHDLIRRLN